MVIVVKKVSKVPRWLTPLKRSLKGLELEGCEIKGGGCAVARVTLQEALSKKGLEKSGLFLRILPVEVDFICFGTGGKVWTIPSLPH